MLISLGNALPQYKVFPVSLADPVIIFGSLFDTWPSSPLGSPRAHKEEGQDHPLGLGGFSVVTPLS